jgi:hypothetical protein
MKRMLRDLLVCHRGSVALMFSAIAIPAIGLTAFGAEVGSWHVIRRAAQNAADAAAYAAAIALVNDSSANVQTEGSKFAVQNNFQDGHTTSIGATQTVKITANPGKTRVTAVITQNQPTFLASLWLPSRVPITATAAAQIKNQQKPCALALNTLTIQGNEQLSGGNCALAANTTVKFNSDATFLGTGWSVDSAQGCLGPHCNPNNATVNYAERPAVQPVSLTNLNSDVATGVIPKEPKKPATVPCCATLSPSASWQGNLNVTGTLSLSNGTYLFDSLTIATGGTLQLAPGATGVNIVIGNGGLTISGNGKVNLQAAAVNNVYPDLDGVLIYDVEAGKVQLAGDTTSVFGGALFFPNADLTWNGNAASANNCTEIVASTLLISGNTNLNIQGCVAGTLPTDQIVFLVQ